MPYPSPRWLVVLVLFVVALAGRVLPWRLAPRLPGVRGWRAAGSLVRVPPAGSSGKADRAPGGMPVPRLLCQAR